MIKRESKTESRQEDKIDSDLDIKMFKHGWMGVYSQNNVSFSQKLLIFPSMQVGPKLNISFDRVMIILYKKGCQGIK